MEEIQQRWLFGLSAPMVALNPPASYSDAAFYPSPQFVDLQCSWSISDRAGLLDMFKGMVDNGHARHIDGAYRQWERRLPSEWHALLDTLSLRERAFHEFAGRTFGSCGPGGIRAWDLGRMGFLLRCGLRNDWIDLTESLWLHGRLAVRARHYYGNWFAYLNSFLAGHAYWSCLNSSDEKLAYELERQGESSGSAHIARTLAHDMSSYLADLPWDLQLDLPQRPSSLDEFDWS